MSTDPDGTNGSAILKATLAGIYLAVAFASGGAVPGVTVGAAAIGAGLTLLQQHLERIRTARTKKDQQAAMDALCGLVQQGFELQEQYDHDLAVFLRGDIEKLSHQVDGWLATLSNELADVDAAIGAVREQSDTLARAMSTLASLVEGDRHLALRGPLGFRRLDRQLFITGGGGDAGKTARLTPVLFRPDGPNWTDFMHGVPFRRQEVDEVVDHLEDDQHDKRVVVLEGESASGKTVIARYAGYVLMARGRPVYHADFHELCQGGGLDLSNTSAFFEQLDAGIHQARQSFDSKQVGGCPELAVAPRPVFIIEDLHRESHDTAVRFIEVLNDHVPDHADFILVTRPASQRKPDGEGEWSIWEHSESRAARARPWLLSTPQTFEKAVNELAPHIWCRRWELGQQDVPFELNSDHISRIAGEASRSLWLTTWILAGHDGDPSQAFDKRLAIDNAGQYLREIAQRAGLDNLERRLPGKPVICTLILAVSVFSRWEVPVDRYFVADILLEGEPRVTQDELLRVFADLVATSELLSDADGAVRLPHSALADVYLQAEEDTDVARYAQGCLDAFTETLKDDERAVVDSIVGSWQKVSRQVHPDPDALGVLETCLLSVAIIRDEPGGSFGLFNDWRLAAAAAGAVENAEPAIARAILKVFLRCVAHARLEASSNALRELKKLVHRGKLDSRQIIAVSDELCQAAKGHQVADVVKASSWFAPNDACAVEWLKGQWERAITDEQVDIETQAACALAYRGHAEEDHWETIYARLCEVHPPDPVLRVVRGFPNERWVKPLRTLLRSTENNELLWPLTGAWAEQSTVYDPDDVIAEIALVAERLIGILLIGGDILPRIDSPMVVELLLELVGGTSDPRADGRTHRALDRLNDVWLPRAVAGFEGDAGRVDDTARDVLETLVRTDTGDSTYWQTSQSLCKEAAWEAAARLNLPGLPDWLLDTLGDSKPFVAADAADMLGWWEAEDAVEKLADVLRKDDTEMSLAIASGRALSCIGGARTVDALLNWPVRLEDGRILWDMLEFLADATMDIDAVQSAISRFSKPGVSTDLLWSAAEGIASWAWLDWYTRKRDGARAAEEDVDRVRDKICAILSGPEVRDERAWCSLINTLGALGPSEQSLHVLRTYVATGSNDLKASAITAAAWSGQCLDGNSLELARGIDAGTLNWVNRDVLTSVVCALLNHDAETVNALRPEEVESVSLVLMSDYRFDDLEKFAVRHPERVRKVIATQVDQKLLSSQSDNALNAAAVRFASEALAERFQTEDCREWCEPNFLSFAVELRCCHDSKSGLQCELIEAALEFLCEALTYPNVRVRDAAAGTLIALDQQAFSECVGRLMDSEDWRDRVAATEACGLLKQEEGEDILSRAWKDFDSRIRSTMHWAKERTREREVQDVALTAVERSHDVPTAFRWKQSLIHTADDWGLHRVTEIIRDPGTAPAKTNWLKTVHEDMKREWEKRTRERDRSIKWEE